jgi:hypothetical protein
MVRVDSFEEAAELRRRYPLRTGTRAKARDALDSIVNWHRYYFGFEPRSFVQSRVYARKLRRAVRERRKMNH